MTTPISLADPGAGDDSWFNRAPVIGDAGAASDSPFTVAAGVALPESGVADEQPWEYPAIGSAIFPYYASVDGSAAGRVNVGDKFLWYAAG